MSISMLILSVAAVLVYAGLLQRVLDRMRLRDRTALVLIALMFAGTLLPPVEVGMIAVNVGGAVIPLGVCAYLVIRAERWQERLHALIGAILTGAAVYFLSAILPDEPEEMLLDVNLIWGLAAGVIACVLCRSRRGAFISGVTGVLLADVAVAVVNWQRGIAQQLVLGGGGAADAAVISGVTAVLLAELVGEIRERFARRRVQRKEDEA